MSDISRMLSDAQDHMWKAAKLLRKAKDAAQEAKKRDQKDFYESLGKIAAAVADMVWDGPKDGPDEE